LCVSEHLALSPHQCFPSRHALAHTYTTNREKKPEKPPITNANSFSRDLKSNRTHNPIILIPITNPRPACSSLFPRQLQFRPEQPPPLCPITHSSALPFTNPSPSRQRSKLTVSLTNAPRTQSQHPFPTAADAQQHTSEPASARPLC
jgi:hypothetical protein